MRLLDRYLLRELLVPLVYCLVGFLIFWIAFDLFDRIGEFKEKELLFFDIAEYYLARTPEFLALVLPIALLLAILYALTNHARHHEITAIRAAGVSLWRICLPHLAVGFLLSAGLLVINEFWADDSDEASDRILTRRLPGNLVARNPSQVRNLGFTNAREQRVWQIGIYDALSGNMVNPQILWRQPDGSRLWVTAASAEPAPGGWVFHQVRQFLEGAQTNAIPLPILETNRLFIAFTETPDEIRSEIRISRVLGMRGARKTDIPIEEIVNYLRLHPNPSAADRAWLYTKLHGRLALPWTCLVVVLVAIPFGAPSGRRNLFVGVASSIVLCFAYFVLQQMGLALGSGQHLPPWLAAWLPNIVFGLGGVWLTARVR